MKKIVFTFFMMFFLLPSMSYAVDWSQFESIRNNIRVEGYQSMPGYIAFGDGAGKVYGIVWMSSGTGLVWCTVGNGTSYTASNNPNSPSGVGVINLKTTKLTNNYGAKVSDNNNPGTIVGVAY